MHGIQRRLRPDAIHHRLFSYEYDIVAENKLVCFLFGVLFPRASCIAEILFRSQSSLNSPRNPAHDDRPTPLFFVSRLHRHSELLSSIEYGNRGSWFGPRVLPE